MVRDREGLSVLTSNSSQQVHPPLVFFSSSLALQSPVPFAQPDAPDVLLMKHSEAHADDRLDEPSRKSTVESARIPQVVAAPAGTLSMYTVVLEFGRNARDDATFSSFASFRYFRFSLGCPIRLSVSLHPHPCASIVVARRHRSLCKILPESGV